MKFLSFICIIVAFAPSVYAGYSGEDPESSEECEEEASHATAVPNKVKLIEARSLFASDEYYTSNVYYEVVRVNETYNRLVRRLERIKDFPADAEARIEVYRSNLNSDNYQKIRDLTFPYCSPSRSDAYLGASTLEAIRLGTCRQKKFSSSSDYEYFKFYDLLSEEELKNAKFIMIRNAIVDDNVVISSQFDFISNVP